MDGAAPRLRSYRMESAPRKKTRSAQNPLSVLPCTGELGERRHPACPVGRPLQIKRKKRASLKNRLARFFENRFSGVKGSLFLLAPLARRVFRLLSVRFLLCLWGALCPRLVSVLRRYLRLWCVLLALRSPRGRVAPSACRFALRVGRFPALWPWCGFPRRWLPPGLPCLGGGACRPCAGGAWFARFRVALRCPFRWRRRPRWAVAGRPVRWPPGSPPAVALLSLLPLRVVAVRSRSPFSRRLPRRPLLSLRRRLVVSGRCPFCGCSLLVCRPAWPGLPVVASLAGCFVGPVAALPLVWG